MRDASSGATGPLPHRAADWPDLRLDAVVPDPDHAERVLLVARWPAHPEMRALLVIEVDCPAGIAHRLLMHWRDVNASLSPRAFEGDVLVLRVGRSNDAVSARVLREIDCSGSVR